jgi:hypothetical protein
MLVRPADPALRCAALRCTALHCTALLVRSTAANTGEYGPARTSAPSRPYAHRPLDRRKSSGCSLSHHVALSSLIRRCVRCDAGSSERAHDAAGAFSYGMVCCNTAVCVAWDGSTPQAGSAAVSGASAYSLPFDAVPTLRFAAGRSRRSAGPSLRRRCVKVVPSSPLHCDARRALCHDAKPSALQHTAYLVVPRPAVHPSLQPTARHQTPRGSCARTHARTHARHRCAASGPARLASAAQWVCLFVATRRCPIAISFRVSVDCAFGACVRRGMRASVHGVAAAVAAGRIVR